MEHDELDDFERELKVALERRPAPPSLKRRVMERRGQRAAGRWDHLAGHGWRHPGHSPRHGHGGWRHGHGRWHDGGGGLAYAISAIGAVAMPIVTGRRNRTSPSTWTVCGSRNPKPWQANCAR